MRSMTPPAMPGSTWEAKLTQNWRNRSWITCSLALNLMVLGAVKVARADNVDDYVTAQMARQHIPGVSLAVLKDGKPMKMRGYGFANLELPTPATPESVYQIGSASKQFIAAAILLLNAEGKVGLDDSVRKYISDAPETWQPITVRHLLTHTSGLERETPGFQLKAQSDVDTIRASYPAPLAFTPGTKWQYSNLGYSVLAEIISRAARVPWPQYVQEHIFAPLGMNSTRTTTSEELIPHRANGYQWIDSNKYQNAPMLPGIRPSGAFLSTVTDLAKWDAALYFDKILSHQQRELMWTPVKLSDGSEKPYGFGWEVAKLGKHTQVKHAGTMLGFRSQVLRFPDDRLTVVVLTNATQATPEKIALGVAAFYIPDLKPAQPKLKSVKLSKEVLDSYSGRYQFQGNRVLTIERYNDGLRLDMPMALPDLGKELAVLVQGVSMNIASLAPENETHFFDTDDASSTYVFSKDAAGTVQLAVYNREGKVVQKGAKIGSQK
jgi:D-alanyl-D-alanine carboxypeptidase